MNPKEEMLLSDMIKMLEYCKENYGDIPVAIVVSVNEEQIFSFQEKNNIFTRYEQFEDQSDRIAISNFIY